MADASQFDHKQYQEEILRKLKGLEREAIVAFAVRCAWRAAPWAVAGWSKPEQRADRLRTHMPGLQAALAAAMLRIGRGTISASASAFAAAAANVSDNIVADAYITDGVLVAAAGAATAAAADTIATAVAAAAETAAVATDAVGHGDPELIHFMEEAAEADISLLRTGISVERLFHQPLWSQAPEALVDLRYRWQEVISILPETEVFVELIQRMLQGEPDWERLQRVYDDWWRVHPKNPDHQSSQKKAATVKMKPEQAAWSETAIEVKETPTGQPPEPKTRRIIQSRLVSTTCVTADGEAEKLTPTAQRCMLALREFLVSDETRPPLTVAVEAPWGGGKSSLMRHLQDALTNDVDATTKQRPFKEESIPTVWFNPWKHEAGKTLWAAFAVAFERQMAEHCGFWTRTWKRICLAWERLETMEKAQLGLRFAFWIVAFLALACIAWQQAHTETAAGWKDQMLQHAPWLGMIVTLWAFLKDAVNQLGSPLKLDVSRLLTHNDHADKVDDLHRFHEDFRRLLHAYIPKRGCKPGKAVVFIDDLDRCEAPKAAELLQSLHQMLNVHERIRGAEDKDAPGIICVLGMDREKVAAAVAAKHEKLLPLLMKTDANGKVSRENAMIFGHEFLEKFIQLTLHLPPMQGRDLDEYLVSITSAKQIKQETSTTSGTTVTVTQGGTAVTPASSARLPTTTSDPTAQKASERQEQKAAVERIERVSEDLDDGRVVLQCARYVAPALENNPRKLKQFVNLFRLRLYLTAAMNFLDLPDRDAEKSDVESLRPSPPGKLSVHHLAKLVALELAAPSEMAAIREKPTKRMFEALEAAFPADEKPLLNALVASRDVYEPDAYDLGKAALDAYFHFFRAEATKEQAVPA